MDIEKHASSGTKPRAPLNRERVLRAALVAADKGGIESLTMRTLARKLRLESPMSLYNHVANKGDLVDGIVDIVFGEVALPTIDVDWSTAMRGWAISTRQTLARHRWAVGLMEWRTNPGPANLRLYDAVLGCLREAGFSADGAVHAYSTLTAYVYGFALLEKSFPFESLEQSAVAIQAMLSRFPDSEYPHLAEIRNGRMSKAGYSMNDEFEFGVAFVLEGLERARAKR